MRAAALRPRAAACPWRAVALPKTCKARSGILDRAIVLRADSSVPQQSSLLIGELPKNARYPSQLALVSANSARSASRSASSALARYAFFFEPSVIAPLRVGPAFCLPLASSKHGYSAPVPPISLCSMACSIWLSANNFCALAKLFH